MKTIIISIIIVACSLISNAQQQSLFSQYLLNSFLINPGIAGTDERAPLQLTARSQWAGIKDAPSTQAISGHTPMGKTESIGVGGFIYNDHFGPVSQIGIHGAFSYRLKVSANTRLSMGLSFSAFQYKISESGLNIISHTDAAITGKTESVIAPDANFGMYLYNKDFYMGLSSTQLIPYKLKLNDATNLSQLVRHYYFLAGYRFKLGDDFILEPSALVKMTETNPVQFDANLKLYYKRNYWLGFSYRTDDAAVVMLGLSVDRYRIGYAFDYTLSKLSNFTYGSHEIMLGIYLRKPAEIKNFL
jgi:type IX secretion system PorP/SprF family membrane protein